MAIVAAESLGIEVARRVDGAGLTGDHKVTYDLRVDLIFKALADPTRRSLLDELFSRDGQSLTELEDHFAMTRFGVMKHLKQLEEAGLVVTRKRGREKLHYLNPIPIRLVHDRWVSKYAEPWVSTLVDLKQRLEHRHGEGFRDLPLLNASGRRSRTRRFERNTTSAPRSARTGHPAPSGR